MIWTLFSGGKIPNTPPLFLVRKTHGQISRKNPWRDEFRITVRSWKLWQKVRLPSRRIGEIQEATGYEEWLDF